MSRGTEAARNGSIAEGRAGPGSEASSTEGDFAPVHAEYFNHHPRCHVRTARVMSEHLPAAPTPESLGLVMLSTGAKGLCGATAGEG